MLERSGEIPAGALAAGSVPRIARQMGLTGKRPCVRVDCELANHVHVFDCSGSENLYVEDMLPGGIPLLGVRASTEKEQKNRRIHKNKKSEKKTGHGRLLVYYYGLVDWHSRALYVDVKVVSGETLHDSVEFLEKAWREKERNPIVGVPDILYTDNGPLGRCRESLEMALSLGYELKTHMPKNAKAKATIERPWRTIWQDMELDFLFDKKRKFTLPDLEEILANYLQEYNDRRSPGFYAGGMSRTDAYRKSLAERGEVRLLPADMNLIECLQQKHIRTVTEYSTVKLNNREYEIIDCPWILLEERVEVAIDINGDLEVRDLQSGKRYQTRPFKPVTAGNYRARKKTINDEVTEAAMEMEPWEDMYYERGAEKGGGGAGVVDLSGAREITASAETSGPAGFASVDQALNYLCDEWTDIPVWKVVGGLETEEFASVKRWLGENLDNRREIDQFGRELRQRMRGHAVNE